MTEVICESKAACCLRHRELLEHLRGSPTSVLLILQFSYKKLITTRIRCRHACQPHTSPMPYTGHAHEGKWPGTLFHAICAIKLEEVQSINCTLVFSLAARPLSAFAVRGLVVKQCAICRVLYFEINSVH